MLTMLRRSASAAALRANLNDDEKRRFSLSLLVSSNRLKSLASVCAHAVLYLGTGARSTGTSLNVPSADLIVLEIRIFGLIELTFWI